MVFVRAHVCVCRVESICIPGLSNAQRAAGVYAATILFVLGRAVRR